MWIYWGMILAAGLLVLISAAQDVPEKMAWYQKPFRKGAVWIQARLPGRKQDNTEKEIAMLPEYEYVVTNDVVEMAVNRMESIITAEKCKVSRSNGLLAKLQGGIK